MSQEKRCGVCKNCRQYTKEQAIVLRSIQPYKITSKGQWKPAHADQDTLDVWQDILERYPCTAPMKLLPLNDTEKATALNAISGQKEICGHKRGEKYIIDNETYLFYDAQAEGSTWEGILLKQDGSAMLNKVPQALMEETRRYG